MAYPGSPLYALAVQKNWPLPDNWSGYSQHSYDCKPLPTAALSAADVLRFRDEAFDAYFGDPRYLEMVTQRFGWDTRKHIEQMASHSFATQARRAGGTCGVSTYRKSGRLRRGGCFQTQMH